MQKLQDNDVPPNQIVQITDQKNVQSTTAAYESDKWKTYQTFSQAPRRRIVKFQMFQSRGAFHFPVGAPPFHHYQLSSGSSTSSAHEN